MDTDEQIRKLELENQEKLALVILEMQKEALNIAKNAKGLIPRLDQLEARVAALEAKKE